MAETIIRYRQKESGFTIIELVVSIAVTAMICVGISVLLAGFSSSQASRAEMLQLSRLGESIFSDLQSAPYEMVESTTKTYEEPYKGYQATVLVREDLLFKVPLKWITVTLTTPSGIVTRMEAYRAKESYR